MHKRPSERRLLRCGDCGAWTCSWRFVRRRVWVFAVVVSCFVPWCVLACGAARVPCLACVWRALLARACCCAGAGTHPLSGGPVRLHGGLCWRPAAARCATVGCVYVWGGGFGSSPPAFPALSLCPSSPACPACLTLGQELCLQYPWAKNSVFSTPGPRTLFSVFLGQELCHQYPWVEESLISTPGPRTLSSVALGHEISHQYSWANNSVVSTPGPRSLSSVPLGQELCHQYPWAKNSVISTPGPRTLSSVPPGQELCHQYPWV